MRITAIAMAFAASVWSSVALPQTDEHALDGLVIRDVTVVSPERATPLEHAYVHILDEQIVVHDPGGTLWGR